MEQEGFLRLAAKYKDTVYRVALNMLASPADADDVTQETLLRLLYSKKPFSDDEYAKRWLIRVCINLCKNELRSAWRKKRGDMPEDVPVFDREGQRELYSAVMSLPEKYRTALYLFYYEEMSAREIGELTGISESAVTTRLCRGKPGRRLYIRRRHLPV